MVTDLFSQFRQLTLPSGWLFTGKPGWNLVCSVKGRGILCKLRDPESYLSFTWQWLYVSMGVSPMPGGLRDTSLSATQNTPSLKGFFTATTALAPICYTDVIHRLYICILLLSIIVYVCVICCSRFLGFLCSFFLQYFDTVGWVFWPVKTVSHITYTVLAGT